MKARTLTGRITFLLGLTTVILLGGAAVLMDQLVDAEMQQRFDADLLTQAGALAAWVEIDGPDRLRKGASDTLQLPSKILTGGAEGAYAVHCDDGFDLHSNPPPRDYPPGWPGRAMPSPAYADVHVDGALLRAVRFDFAMASDGAAGGSCRLILMQPRATMDSILLTIDIILLVIPMLALLLVLLLSPFLVRRGLQPLQRLGESMRDIGPQKPGRRLALTGVRELEPLVIDFNQVLAHMDDVLARERRFTDALAHETRTRLAELHTLVDVERRYPSGRPLDALLQEIGAIGGDLEGTVSGLLLLTRLDAGLESLEWKSIDPALLVERHVARVAVQARQRHLTVDAVAPPHSVSVRVDVSLVDIVLGNLLANACAYAPTGGRVRIAWDSEGLTVSNHAPDLDREEVACLGQRFWSKQRGRDGHIGLGLALAGTAAAAMGFRMRFRLDEDSDLHAVLEWQQIPEAGDRM